MSNTNIYKALSEFQQEVPVIHKDTQGYGYTYADLPKIFEVINPLLKKYKLGFTQPMDGNCIKTIVFHTETGETIESSTVIPEGVQLKGMNDFQVLGSAITYLRRYALSSILGLVTDKDNDGAGEQKTKPNNTSGKPADAKQVDVWLSEESFNKTKVLPKDDIKKCLIKYDGKSEHGDGKIYGMKKEFRTELEKLSK